MDAIIMNPGNRSRTRMKKWVERTRIDAVLNILILFSACCAAPCAALSAAEEPGSKISSGPMLGILVDVSPHQKKVLNFEREAVGSVLTHLEGIAAESFIIEYSDRVRLLQDWSPPAMERDKSLSKMDLDSETGRHERTILYNALYSGIQKLASRVDSSSKFLIIVGEGNDAGSSARYAQIKALARSAHIRCFVLLVADHNLMGGRVRHFGFYLYDLAGATKGAGYDIEASRRELDKAVGNLAGRMRLADDSSKLQRP